MTGDSGLHRTSSETRSARSSGRPAAPASHEIEIERQRLVDDLVKADLKVQRWREKYERALVSAREFGMSHAFLAAKLGKSETAVRLFLKRHGHGGEK